MCVRGGEKKDGGKSKEGLFPLYLTFGYRPGNDQTTNDVSSLRMSVIFYV